MSKKEDMPLEKKELTSEKSGLGSSATIFKSKVAPEKKHNRFSADKLKEIKLNFTPGREKLIRKLKQLIKKIPQDELADLYHDSDYKDESRCTLYEDVEDRVSTKPLPEREPLSVFKNILIKIKTEKSTADPALKSTQSAEVQEIDFDNWEMSEETDSVFKTKFKIDKLVVGQNSLYFTKQAFPDIYPITDNLFIMDGPYNPFEDLVSFFEQCLFKPKIRDGIHKTIIFSAILRDHCGETAIQDYVTTTGLDYLSDTESSVEPNIYLVSLTPHTPLKQESEPQWGLKRAASIRFEEELAGYNNQKLAEFKIDPSKIDIEKPINDQISREILDKIIPSYGVPDKGFLYRIIPLSEKVIVKDDVQINTFSIRKVSRKSIRETKAERLETFTFSYDKIRKENHLKYYDELLDFYEASLKENVLIQGRCPEYLLLLFQFLKNHDKIFNATNLGEAQAKIEEIVNNLQKNLPLIPNEDVIRQAITDAEKLHQYQLTRAAPATVPTCSL